MPRGGRREGAGRPAAAERKKSAEEVVMEGISRQVQQIRKSGVTTELIREMAVDGLGTLWYHARRGNISCAKYLVDLGLQGDEVQDSFADSLPQMDAGQLAAAMGELLSLAGLNPEIGVLIVENLAALPAEAAAAPLPAIAGPDPTET